MECNFFSENLNKGFYLIKKYDILNVSKFKLFGGKMSKIIKYSGEDIENEVVKKEGITLIDFYADWCGPCKIFETILEEIAEDEKYKIVKIDTDEYGEIPKEFGIRSIPTVLLYKDGKFVEKISGFSSKVEFEKKLKKL